MDVERTETADGMGRPILSFKSPKFTQSLVVSKENNGFALYCVHWSDKGKVPKELSGSYSRLTFAEQAIKTFLKNAKKSPVVRRDENTAKREARKKSNK